MTVTRTQTDMFGVLGEGRTHIFFTWLRTNKHVIYSIRIRNDSHVITRTRTDMFGIRRRTDLHVLASRLRLSAAWKKLLAAVSVILYSVRLPNLRKSIILV
jgi:hypothetical protein